MDLRGYRMIVDVGHHPEYKGLGDYFGTGTPRTSKHRTLKEWVVFAEALAKEHDGVLPRVSWIQKNHSGLASAMHKHPKRFEHIPQERLRKTFRTLEQWVVFAEALANEHGGVLPHVRWIQKNHPGLRSAMRKHPKRFEHIPQDKPQGHHRTLEQWVVFAEALANEHGGILPCADWIKKNHSGLANAMREHPGRFEHIQQEKPYGHRRTLEQWVVFAKALAKERGGILPCADWIQKNHSGLANAIRRNPKLFSGLRQEIRDGHGFIGYRVLGEEEKEAE